MKKIIMIAFMLAMLFPMTISAANDTKIAIYYDGITDKYQIYPSRACTYELSDSKTNVPAVFNQIYDNPNDVIEVDGTNINGIARYLWIDGNDDPYDLQSYIAINDSDINHIDNTMKRITIKPVTNGDRVITLTKDENYTNYSYILVKVEKGTSYDLLVTRTESLDPSLNITDPYTGITKMLSYKESYDTLLPNTNDTRWTPVPQNGVIEEPLDTKTGDIYVVWLMAEDSGVPVLDMQIMYCLREDEKIVTIVEQIPHTGIDYFIDGLLITNIVILPIIYFRRRKLLAINEK